MKKINLINRSILLIACTVGVVAFHFTPLKPVVKRKQPNVVIILADQWRGQAMGYLGKEKVQTPNIDSFAKEGLTLSQMVSNYPVCSPARAMLLTGTYPVKIECSVILIPNRHLMV